MTTSELTQRIFHMLLDTKSMMRHWNHDAMSGRIPDAKEIKECATTLYWNVREGRDLPNFGLVIDVVTELIAPINRLTSTSSENVRKKSVNTLVMAMNIIFVYCDGVSTILDPEVEEVAA